jgi:hypothetical protein
MGTNVKQLSNADSPLTSLLKSGDRGWRAGFCSAVLVQTNGWQASLPANDEGLDGCDEVLDRGDGPLRMACRVMVPKEISTRFCQGPDVELRCSVIGLSRSH